MPLFPRDHTVESKTPILEIPAGAEPGHYRVQLVVVNARGVESLPVVHELVILKPRIPIPVPPPTLPTPPTPGTVPRIPPGGIIRP